MMEVAKMPQLGPDLRRPPLIPEGARELPNFPVWVPSWKDKQATVPPVPASLVMEQKLVREGVHAVIALKFIIIALSLNLFSVSISRDLA